MLANDSSITGTVTSTGGLSIPGRDPGAGVLGFSSTGAGVPHWARHCAVGAEPRISVTGSHTEATRSSAVDAGFSAPRVSQTLSPTVFSSPMPNFALQTTDDLGSRKKECRRSRGME